MLGGGLPRGKIILVCGGPGSGKTIISAQFLYQGARSFGEPGLFVTLVETPESIKSNMKGLGIDIEGLERKGMFAFLNLSSMAYLSPEEFHRVAYGVKVPEFTVESTVATIKRKAEQIRAARIAVDCITSLSLHEMEEARKRRNVAHFFRGLHETGCTCLVTMEARQATLEREFQVEEYLAEGVIVLQTLVKASQLVRVIRVEKIRGTSHDTQPRPYRITSHGIEVFPSESVI